MTGLTELAAQGHHGDAHDVGERVRVLVPRLLQELFRGDDGTLAAQQHLQDGELLGRELDFLAVAEHLSAVRVELDAGALQDGRQRHARTASEGTHACRQLAEREGLGQIVVGADLQALDTVADVAGRREHQHAGGHAELDDLAADIVAVHEREVPVEDDHVVVVDADALQGGRTVVHDVDGHGLPAQSGGHRIGEQLLVLDDEYAHVACPSSVHPRSAPRRTRAGSSWLCDLHPALFGHKSAVRRPGAR